MGIFKDLGFVNHNGEITAPSSKKFNGYTLEEVKAQINTTFVQIDASIDGQAIIDGSSLPTTVMQDTDWSSIQPVAYGFKSVDENIGNYIKTIYSNQPAVNDGFGVSCAIGSTFMLVGSLYDDDKGSNTGKVEMFAINTTKPTLTINNVVQTEESSSLTETIYKSQMVNTNTLTISSTGSIESVDISTYILD